MIFGWFDWVGYITPHALASTVTHDGTEVPIQQVKQLGRYLGPDLNVGDALTGTVLTEKARTL